MNRRTTFLMMARTEAGLLVIRFDRRERADRAKPLRR